MHILYKWKEMTHPMNLNSHYLNDDDECTQVSLLRKSLGTAPPHHLAQH